MYSVSTWEDHPPIELQAWSSELDAYLLSAGSNLRSADFSQSSIALAVMEQMTPRDFVLFGQFAKKDRRFIPEEASLQEIELYKRIQALQAELEKKKHQIFRYQRGTAIGGILIALIAAWMIQTRERAMNRSMDRMYKEISGAARNQARTEENIIAKVTQLEKQIKTINMPETK